MVWSAVLSACFHEHVDAGPLHRSGHRADVHAAAEGHRRRRGAGGSVMDDDAGVVETGVEGACGLRDTHGVAAGADREGDGARVGGVVGGPQDDAAPPTVGGGSGRAGDRCRRSTGDGDRDGTGDAVAPAVCRVVADAAGIGLRSNRYGWRRSTTKRPAGVPLRLRLAARRQKQRGESHRWCATEHILN